MPFGVRSVIHNYYDELPSIKLRYTVLDRLNQAILLINLSGTADKIVSSAQAESHVGHLHLLMIIPKKIIIFMLDTAV